MEAAMWNLSYGRVAEQDLASWRAGAARATLIAQASPPGGAAHPVRQAIGELLIRAGARLAMPSSPAATTLR
jgi:hypothetical protein